MDNNLKVKERHSFHTIESVVIIEDDTRMARNIELIVSSLGYQVEAVFYDAASALNYFQSHEFPHFLLVDVNLPGGMNGVSLVEELSKSGACAVIYITGNVTEEPFRSSQRSNIYAYISKPFRKIDLDYAFKVSKIRLEYEDKIKKASQQISKKAKLIQLGEFAGSLVHDINNFNTVIIGSFWMIQRLAKTYSQEDAAKIYTLSEKGQKGSTRITQLTTRYRSLLKTQEDEKFEDIPLKEVVGEAIDYFYESLRKHSIKTYIDIAEYLAVKVQPVSFLQCIVNLFSNAIYAVKDQKEKWIRIVSEIRGGRLILRVIDSGPGISEDVADQIFDQLFTTKDVDHGTGFGLSFVRNSLKRQEIGIQYKENTANTTFELGFREGSYQIIED